jgi:hypothetical protein
MLAAQENVCTMELAEEFDGGKVGNMYEHLAPAP